jgi:hypothetical protein
MKLDLVTWNPMPILDLGTWQALRKQYLSKRISWLLIETFLHQTDDSARDDE